MPAKLFVSYSHKDEQFRAALETHLSQMRRNGDVETWSDRKIMPGQEWKGQIDKNLEVADVVIFLVSADFLASDYCCDVEVRRALAMHDSGRAKVLPVILRHCDWKNSPFGKLQALPPEAKPIVTWSHQDEAWMSVVEGVKDYVPKAGDKDISFPRQKTIWHNALSAIFYDWLNDTEIELSHRHVKKVLLEDIFVRPDLKDLDADTDIGRVASVVNSDEVVANPGWKLIFGDEQIGKTSLIKHYYVLLLQQGWTPVLVQGSNVKSSDVRDAAKKAYQEQYRENDWDKFEKSDRKVLLIDDCSDFRLNRKYTNRLIERIKQDYSFAVFFAIDSYQYVVSEISALDGFRRYEILRFGNIKRAELIEKWLSIGVREQIDERHLYDGVDVLKTHLDSFVSRNVVPSKPIYLLSILQTFDTFKPQQVELTSYGHCYQYLIYQALESAHIRPSEFDSYINILTDLARAIFESEGKGLEQDELAVFFQDYHTKYLKVDQERVIKTLIECRILCDRNGRTNFKYRYIYYFYAAKYLAEQLIKNKGSTATIRQLLTYLHKEDCANIIIFITHHTKDEWILDEIQMCMMELFQEQKEATLESKDLEFMVEFLGHIPKLVIEQREIEEERKQANVKRDAQETAQQEIDRQLEKSEPTDLLAKINRTFKGIELIGQIVRNRHGSLERKKLREIVEQAQSVGLRFLQYFLGLTGSSREEVIQTIEYMLKENPGVQNDKLEKEARTVFLLMTYGVIYGVLRKIAMSIGSREAEEIYQEIEKERGTPAIKLISQAIELQFQKRVSEKRLKALAEEFKTNLVCRRVLQEIVTQHIYMHHVDYQQKQMIAESLDLSMAKQRAQELQKKLKI